MPATEPWVVALAAALSVALAVIVLVQGTIALREWRIRRDALGTLRPDSASGGATDPRTSVVRSNAQVNDGLLESFGEGIPQLWDLHHLIGQAGLGWTVSGLFARCLAAAMLAGVLPLILGSLLTAVVLAIAAAPVPYMYVRRKKTRRLLQVEAQLPGAIDLIARAVRAGHPLSEGLRMASEEASEPLASEFRVTFDEQKFGLPFEEALLGLGDRLDIVDVRILITAILVQREVGGNLSEILEQIAETMRARFSLKRQVRVYTAQGRMSGYTLAALPIIVGLVITMINPDYMQTLFREPLGHALLASAGVMQFIGFLWIRRIVDIRY